MAAREGYLKIVDLLLSSGARTDLKTIGGDTCLTIAATQGRVDVVTRLLTASDIMNADEKSAWINNPNKGGITPLGSAATRGHAKIIEMLLFHGAGN